MRRDSRPAEGRPAAGGGALAQPQDYILFAAAIRATQQLRGPEVTSVLTEALGQLPDDRQISVILALGRRRDPAALPALTARAKASAKPVRLAAIRTLAELGQAKALPALLESLGDTDRDLARASLESLASLPGREVDAAVMAMFAGADASRRLKALELIGRRRMTSAMAALLKAAGEPDPQIHSAVMQRLGELGGPAELPALFDMLLRGKQSRGPRRGRSGRQPRPVAVGASGAVRRQTHRAADAGPAGPEGRRVAYPRLDRRSECLDDGAGRGR